MSTGFGANTSKTLQVGYLNIVGNIQPQVVVKLYPAKFRVAYWLLFTVSHYRL